MIFQVLNAIFSGMGVGFNAMIKAIPIYQAFSGLKEEFIAAIIGVPTLIVSICFAVWSISKIVSKVVNKV